MAVPLSTILGNLYPQLHAIANSDLVFTNDDELKRFLSDCVKRLAEDFGVFIVRNATQIVLFQGQAQYPAPPRHLSTLHISIDGLPLVAASTLELELRDENYLVTQGTPRRWYQDKIGTNRIGFQPVPDAGSAGKIAEVIYHQFPCSIEDGIDTPRVFVDYAEAVAAGEAYMKESDFQIPESAQSFKQLAQLFEAAAAQYWNPSAQ